MIKRLWASIKAFFYTTVAATESQPKENTVKLELTLLINNQLADGSAANTAQVTLTDDSDAVQPGAVVNLTADNGAIISPTSGLTDANGQITASIVSSVAGSSVVTATTADGSVVRGQVSFAAAPAPAALSQEFGMDSVHGSLIKTPAVPTTDGLQTAALSPLETMKADFDKVVAFIEHGIEVLGKDAEADLVAMKNKFLG